jgi:RAT1-interacting protein
MATTKRKISELDPPYSQEGHDNKRLRPGSPDDASSVVDHKLSYPSRSSRSHDIRPVAFQQPTPLVTFSYNSSRVLEFNNSSLRYYVDPPPGADLKYGYDRWIRRPEEKGRIDGLLKAYMKVREKNPGVSLNGGVVAWRGVMTR